MNTLQDKDYTDILPRGTASVIHQELEGKVNIRTIQRVLSGQSSDIYGILPIAARIAKEHEESIAVLNRIKESSTPNQHKR